MVLSKTQTQTQTQSNPSSSTAKQNAVTVIGKTATLFLSESSLSASPALPCLDLDLTETFFC